jgi:hypothetical protein
VADVDSAHAGRDAGPLGHCHRRPHDEEEGIDSLLGQGLGDELRTGYPHGV